MTQIQIIIKFEIQPFISSNDYIMQQMKEYIFLNIGSSGVNLAQSYWHLFCLEHGISPHDGEPDLLCLPKDDDNPHVIFRETKTIPYGPIKYTPRSVFVGEQSEIDSIRAGSYKNLFPAESLIDCPSECGGVYSKSYILKDQLEKTLEQIRKETELADSIEGFMLFNSIGGGLGSGFTNALLEQLTYILQKVLENDLLVTDITLKLFEQASFLQNIDINQGKYMACAVVYQGDIVPKDVGHGISRIKTSRTIQFVDWCPTGFKCGINYQPMHEQIPDIMNIKRVKRGAMMLGNSSKTIPFQNPWDIIYWSLSPKN